MTNHLRYLPDSAFCHLWTGKLAIKLKNVIQFV